MSIENKGIAVLEGDNRKSHTSWFESNSYPFFAASALAIPTDSYNIGNYYHLSQTDCLEKDRQ